MQPSITNQDPRLLQMACVVNTALLTVEENVGAKG